MMADWLRPALDYARLWLDHRLRLAQTPGCVMAVVRHCEVVDEFALGTADLATGEALSPRSRFRVAMIRVGGTGFFAEVEVRADMRERYGSRPAEADSEERQTAGCRSRRSALAPWARAWRRFWSRQAVT